jgi:hypothetical protein
LRPSRLPIYFRGKALRHVRKTLIIAAVLLVILIPSAWVCWWWYGFYRPQPNTQTVGTGEIIEGVTVSGALRCRQKSDVAYQQTEFDRCKVAAQRASVVQLLLDLNRQLGVTILMVTHEREVAARAGRVVEFLDGRIVSDRVARTG